MSQFIYLRDQKCIVPKHRVGNVSKKPRCLRNNLTSGETKGTQGKEQCQRSVKTKGLEARFVLSVTGGIETPAVLAFSL